MIQFHSTFGAKYLTGMVTSVPPYETFNLIKFLSSLHLVSQYRISLHHFIHEGSLIKSI
jgi:hypothetical protein